MLSHLNSYFKVGDLIKYVFSKYENDTVVETGVIVELFKNSGGQEFAEILWSTGELAPFDIKDIEKLHCEEDI